MAKDTKRTSLTATAVVTTDTVRVYPSPVLHDRGDNLAGVGVGGAEVPAALADEWLAAGLVVLTPPEPQEV